MSHHRMGMLSPGILLRYILLVLLWGSTWAAIKVGVSSVPPFVFAFERAVAVSAVLTTILLALMPISWALATIVQVRVLREGSPLPLVAVGTWTGALVLAPFALTEAGAAQSWTFDVLVAFAYLVVFGSCVGLVLQLWLTRRLRPTTMMLSQLLISSQALIVGAVVLGESITWRMLAGAALVAIALILNALSGGGERAEAAPAASPAE